MSNIITVRPAENADIPQLVDLMNSQYSRKKDGSYFLWQYFNSFYPTILMCAVAETKLIGMFGLQKRKLNSDVQVGQATDLLVSAEWRKQGILTLLGEKIISCFDDLALLCVFPNLNGKNACEKAFGWETAGKINSMILHGDSLNNIAENFQLADNVHEKKRHPARFKYDTETRTWRFKQHPDYRYAYVKATAGAFSVVKIFIDPKTGVRYGDIVDFECDLENRRLLRELFVRSCTYLKEQDVESVTSWALPNTALREMVESLGFTEMPQERYFCLKILKNGFEHLYDLSNWHLVQADSEIY